MIPDLKLYCRDVQKNRLLFRHLQSRNNWKPCLIVWLYVGLDVIENPAATIYNPAMTIYSPPPPHDWCEERTNPLPSYWEDFWWSNLTINSEFKQKVLQYWLAAATLICGSLWFSPYHLHLQLISPLHQPPGKRVSCLFKLGCQLLPWLSRVFIGFPLAILGRCHVAKPPRLTTMRTILPQWTQAL